jgi:biopolymer transport protein ExbB
MEMSGFLLLTELGSEFVGAGMQPAERESLVMLIVRAGGFFGWVILGCSVIGLGLMLEHMFSLARAKLNPQHEEQSLRELLGAGNIEDAQLFCRGKRGLVAHAVGAGLARRAHGRVAMETAASERLEEESVRLHARIGWVALIANLAPLLGLLGTVSGMLWSFGVIEHMANPAPADLAGGIKEALVTTLLGLTVAVPLTVGWYFFRDRITGHVLDAGRTTENLLDLVPAESA